MTEIIVKKPYERFDWKKEIQKRTPAEAKQWQTKEYRRCAEDKIYWFNQYAWTIDTRTSPAIKPFILHSYQIKLIDQLDKYLDLFIDKCRDMGISWTVMGWETHQVLYTKGYTALNISRKESEVQDSGNTFHSLHGRVSFIYDRLPPFLKPRIHKPFLIFSVPSMNSVIKGESANPKAGRDTQYKFIFVDEAAHVDCLDEMWKGLRNASNTICLNSTPPKESVNNKFAEIKDIKNSGFVKMGFDWHENPSHTQEWYNKKTASMTEQEIAQEILRQYDKALTNRSYPEYNDTIHLLDHKVYLNPKATLYCFMDYGLDGEVFLFAQKDVRDRLFILYYKICINMLTQELYIEFIKCLEKLGYRGPIKDIFFIGDKSGNKRNRITKTSVIQDYKTVSNNQIIIHTRELTNDEKMKCTKMALKNKIDGRPQINISKEPTCLNFAKCLKSLTLNKSGADHVDNKFTHAVNAFEYGVNWLFPKTKAAGIVLGVDPGEPVRGIDGEIIKEQEELISGPASINTVIGNYRIERKSIYET